MVPVALPLARPGVTSRSSNKGEERSHDLSGAVVLVLGVSAAQAASITQQTYGGCSPAVGQTGGNVTIHCGDPQIEQRLNERLNKMNLDLQQKTREAYELSRKVNELSRQVEALKDNKLIQENRALLRQGKLEEADALLKRSVISRAHFQNIKDGMSLQQVVGILGRHGVEGPSAGSVISYSWHNPDLSMGVVTFNNGLVIGKNPGNLP
jgi:hypothetical protein